MNNLLLKDNKIIRNSDVLYKWSAGNKLARDFSKTQSEAGEVVEVFPDYFKMYDALVSKKEIVNFRKRQYTALRAPFLTHRTYAKQGYAIFHQNLSDVGSDIATHVKGNFFTGFLNDAAAFEYAVPNTDFRTQLIADGITTLQEMIDKTGNYIAQNLSLGGTLADCNLNWFVGLTGFLLLDRNAFTGVIPAELGNLSNLQYLYLHTNQLSGSIPAELGNLSNLTRLYLYSNQLEGTIPIELGNLGNLQYLRLDGNNLEGTIPAELGNLSNLIWLLLSANQLSGSIPAELGNLSNLQYLYLHTNQLSGSIPAELGNLSNLTRLRLYSNDLTSYEQGAISTTQTVLNDIRFQAQVSTATNTGLPTESIDQIILDVRDMLIANPANTGGNLELQQNFPHSGSQEILDAIAFISDPVGDGGMAWSINVEYSV